MCVCVCVCVCEREREKDSIKTSNGYISLLELSHIELLSYEDMSI